MPTQRSYGPRRGALSCTLRAVYPVKMDETGTGREQPHRPVTITPGPTSLVFTLGSAAAFMGLLYWLIQSLPAEAPAFEATLAFCVVAFSWQWLSRYSVSIDGDGISVSTNYWRLRGRPPIQFIRAAGISAVAYGAFLDRSVTINGLHIETTDIFAHDALQIGLREASIPVEGRSAFRANLAWLGIYSAGYVLGMFAWRNQELGLPALAAAVVLAVAVSATHAVRVDRQWRQIAAVGSSPTVVAD